MTCVPTSHSNLQGKPLSEDTLNLWKGKRLNITESKVEAKLHRLRHNPTARTDLEVCTKVHGLSIVRLVCCHACSTSM